MKKILTGCFVAALLVGFMIGCAPVDETADTTAPAVLYVVPANAAIDVPINDIITATFDEVMDPATISDTTFTVTAPGPIPVAGTVTLAGAGTTAIFTPDSDLDNFTWYTATLTTGAKDAAGNALGIASVWTFQTADFLHEGPQRVILGTAANFAILAKTRIDTVTASTITGDIGISPAAATYITGFSLVGDGTLAGFTTSTQVSGNVYASNYAAPTPAMLTTAVLDMQAAYTDAAGRLLPDESEMGAGIIGGLTIVPGLYKWGTNVSINSDLTLDGGPHDVWIFQVAGDVSLASATDVLLVGGAEPKNVFWQVAGGVGVSVGTSSNFAGIVLTQKAVTLGTSANVDGRLFAQSQVNLDGSTVVEP